VDWLKDLAAPTAATLIWAVVVYRLGLSLITRFESAIAEAVKRLKKLGPAEFDLGQPAQNPERPKELEPASPPKLLAAPDSMIGRLELPIREWLTTIPEGRREEELIKSLVNWQIGWNFEWVNSSVLGSQLQLLGALNSQPLSISQARAFYDHGVQANPDYYANYPFERWIAWLHEAAKLVRVVDEHVSLSEEGREFIKYVVSRGYPLSRQG